jgi:5'-3' exonuclease
VIVHLVDGTSEIFRQYYAPRPGHLDSDGIEIGATRGVVQSVFTILPDRATHVGVATDHIIESFRYDIWPKYKSSASMTRCCWRNSTGSRKHCRHWASRSGPWSM